MSQKVLTILLSILAPTLVFLGLCSMLVAPFLPLAYMDLNPPVWLVQVYPLVALGFVIFSAGICCWALAWKRWFPKNKN